MTCKLQHILKIPLKNIKNVIFFVDFFLTFFGAILGPILHAFSGPKISIFFQKLAKTGDSKKQPPLL